VYSARESGSGSTIASHWVLCVACAVTCALEAGCNRLVGGGGSVFTWEGALQTCPVASVWLCSLNGLTLAHAQLCAGPTGPASSQSGECACTLLWQCMACRGVLLLAPQEDKAAAYASMGCDLLPTTRSVGLCARLPRLHAVWSLTCSTTWLFSCPSAELSAWASSRGLGMVVPNRLLKSTGTLVLSPIPPFTSSCAPYGDRGSVTVLQPWLPRQYSPCDRPPRQYTSCDRSA
jgi:hypothetical protein